MRLTPVARRWSIRSAAWAGGVIAARLRLLFAGGAGAARVQDGPGGQPGQDLVLADVQVLGPPGVGAGGAGVAVAAPVGGFAVGPGRSSRRPQIPQRSSPASRYWRVAGRPGRAARWHPGRRRSRLLAAAPG